MDALVVKFEGCILPAAAFSGSREGDPCVNDVV